jgi:thioredoxin reductase (NADPH)
VRSESLAASMSEYLIERIEASNHITLHPFTEITALYGDNHLDRVTWHNNRDGTSETRAIANIFVMIGAIPNTSWLQGCVLLDQQGFVCTGAEVVKNNAWSLERLPQILETSRPGIFAAGDVRAGSVKRVASAVGEGSISVQFVHRILEEQRRLEQA